MIPSRPFTLTIKRAKGDNLQAKVNIYEPVAFYHSVKDLNELPQLSWLRTDIYTSLADVLWGERKK